MKDISLAACPGQIVAVTGKNGTGKTTLARLMCGLLKESAGKVYFMGKEIGAKQRWKQAWYSANDTNRNIGKTRSYQRLIDCAENWFYNVGVPRIARAMRLPILSLTPGRLKTQKSCFVMGVHHDQLKKDHATG